MDTRAVLYFVLLIVGVVVVTEAQDGADCENDTSISCHGSLILQRMAKQFLNSQDKDVKLADGVHLVETPKGMEQARSVDDRSLSGTIERYLLSRELRISLPELMPKDGIKSTLKNVIDDFSDKSIVKVAESARGKKKGGGGIILLMALMMGKVLAAIGFGSIGFLAMKALMVSALALMLSSIIGIKKLASSGHDDGGHQVIYAGHGGGHESHHRRRREVDDNSVPLPYRAWAEYAKTT